jgi:hypothetical protein
MCLLFKSNGELLLLGFGHATDLIIISYANRAARFISAYGQGLSGPEAAWANRKYHGHRTLPPEMATKLKKHEKNYGTQTNKV